MITTVDHVWCICGRSPNEHIRFMKTRGESMNYAKMRVDKPLLTLSLLKPATFDWKAKEVE